MEESEKKAIVSADSLQPGNPNTAMAITPQGNSLEGNGLSSEKALSKTGGAEISFYYFQKYEEELRKKNDEFIRDLESQRRDFQEQITNERKDALDRQDSQRKELVSQLNEQRHYWEQKLQEREKENNELKEKIINLSISNAFCRSLTGVNIIGACMTLLGTVGASVSAANDIIWLVITLSLVAVAGSLLPQIVTKLSDSKSANTK